MADYTFGGTDEENAELKKLNAEVVRTRLHTNGFAQDSRCAPRPKTPTTSRPGKSSYGLPKLSKVG